MQAISHSLVNLHRCNDYFTCAMFQLDWSMHLHLIAIFLTVHKTRRKSRNLILALVQYLRNSLGFPTCWAPLKQNCFWLDKRSQSCKCLKSPFLSSCQYIHGVVRRFLGPHNTLPSVLILCLSSSFHFSWHLVKIYLETDINLSVNTCKVGDLKKLHLILWKLLVSRLPL